MDLHLRRGKARLGQKANLAGPCEAIQRWQLVIYVVWFQTSGNRIDCLRMIDSKPFSFLTMRVLVAQAVTNMSIDTNPWSKGWRTYDRHRKHRDDNGLSKQRKYFGQKQSPMKRWNPPISGSSWLPFAIVLRNDASACLNDPSDSFFILETSDCKVVSFVAMVVDRDFDPLGDLRRREDKDLIQYDDPRGVTVMPTLSKLLNKIISYNSPKPNCDVTNLLHEAHPSRCILEI